MDILYKKIKGIVKNIILISGLVLLLTSCAKEVVNDISQKRTTYALGTIITIDLMGEGSDRIMTKLINRISEIEGEVSSKVVSSELIKIKEQAGKSSVAISEDTYNIIQTALEYARISEGKFDPTIGPIIELWGIGTDNARVPKLYEIEKAVKLVNYKKVILNNEKREVYLEMSGMSLELGGIAKGYVADELVEILKEESIKSAMLSLGGNIYAYGDKKGGKAWKVAIQAPYKNTNSYFGYLEVHNKTVVTSGPYQRYFEKDGYIYAHIFNALTGYPIESKVLSVTIVGENSMRADALSTILFTMSIEEGLELIENTQDVECIYVDDNKRVWLSSGLINNFTITDKDYELVE